MKIRISSIQHFSVGDGDGIRTTAFFQGCSLRCPWCHNPETVPMTPVTLDYKENGTKVYGKDYEIGELIPELTEDIDYYEASGGGVTLSGGEVLLQADGAAALAAELKRRNVSVFIDTAGCVPYSAFKKVLPFTDTFLYDCKTASYEKFRSVIDGDPALVSANLGRLISDGASVRIRIPLIPGFNTDDGDIAEISAYLFSLGIKAVELLPFHRLGSSKYSAMGIGYAYKAVEPLGRDETERISGLYGRMFDVKTE